MHKMPKFLTQFSTTTLTLLCVIIDLLGCRNVVSRPLFVSIPLRKETQDETEIKNIKKQMGTFVDYDVTFEYDEQGYINKAIIEKL